jgi:hypothetical protein
MHYNGNMMFLKELTTKLKHFALADPLYLDQSEPKSIDILIGAEYFGKILLNESRSLDQLDIRATQFGWIVSGVMPVREETDRFCGYTCQDINETLQKFWKIEEVNTASSSLSDEEEKCDKFFESTFSFAPDGKFVVKLPLKVKPTNISENRYRALSALKRVESKLEHALKLAYNNFMRRIF